MLDALGKDIRRGELIIDRWGNMFTVTSATPTAVRLQDKTTGRRFRTDDPALLRVKGDLGGQHARRALWVKVVLYERGGDLRRLQARG